MYIYIYIYIYIPLLLIQIIHIQHNTTNTAQHNTEWHMVQFFQWSRIEYVRVGVGVSTADFDRYGHTVDSNQGDSRHRGDIVSTLVCHILGVSRQDQCNQSWQCAVGCYSKWTVTSFEGFSYLICGQCQTFKPPMSHQCRIFNRFISCMDHHFPWVHTFYQDGDKRTWQQVRPFLSVIIYMYSQSVVANNNRVLHCLVLSCIILYCIVVCYVLLPFEYGTVVTICNWTFVSFCINPSRIERDSYWIDRIHTHTHPYTYTVSNSFLFFLSFFDGIHYYYHYQFKIKYNTTSNTIQHQIHSYYYYQMNNCVAGNNLKHFLLFLMYTWTCAVNALLLFVWNYFFCANEDCMFHPIVVHLVRVVTMLCVGTILSTSCMLINVCYGLMTGIGTIDCLKKRQPIPWIKVMKNPSRSRMSLGFMDGGRGAFWWIPFLKIMIKPWDIIYCNVSIGNGNLWNTNVRLHLNNILRV